jgi:hypothetical protein
LKKSLFKLFGIAKFLLPLLYLAGAMFIWVVFVNSNPDGLANIWIAIYTFPIFMIGTLLLHQEFPYMPGGYYQAHAQYFWPSVILLAVVMFLIFNGLQNLFNKA